MACAWDVLAGDARPVLCARCPGATSCWQGSQLAGTACLGSPDANAWTERSRAMSGDVGLRGASPHLSALTAMLPSSGTSQAGGTSSWWLPAARPTACALPLGEGPEAAPGRAGSRGMFSDPAASACQGEAARVASSLGRESTSGTSALSPSTTLLRGCGSQASSLSVCKRRCGERPRDCGPSPPRASGKPLRPGRPASREGSAQPGAWLPPCSVSRLRRGLEPVQPSQGPGSTPDIPGQPTRHGTARHRALRMLGGRSHPSPLLPPAFPSGTSRGQEASVPSHLELPTSVLCLHVLSGLAGPRTSGCPSPWRDEVVVQLCCGAAWRCLWRTCGEKEMEMEARDGGSSAGTVAPAALPSPAPASRQPLATPARPHLAPSCSLPLGRCCGARGPRPPRRRLCPRESPRARHGCRLPLQPSPTHTPLPASPSSPVPHLAPLVQERLPLTGLAVGVRLLFPRHLRGPVPDTCHGHPGEMLPPDGAAPWEWAPEGSGPIRDPPGCRAHPLSQWPLGAMPPLVTEAWRSPWRRPRPFAGSPLGTHRPAAGCGSGGTSGSLESSPLCHPRGLCRAFSQRCPQPR